MQTGDQCLTINSFDRLFAGGIDVGHDYRIGVIKTGAEFFKQISESGIAMRLNDGNHISGSVGAGGGEYSGNLNWMMSIVIDDRDPIDDTGFGEAPLNSFEPS